MFQCLSGGLKHIGFLLLTDVQVVHDAAVQLVEDLALTADVVDLVSKVMVDRKRLVELLNHLSLQKNVSVTLEVPVCVSYNKVYSGLYECN